MLETKIENARIENTSLGLEGHGIFTCKLHLKIGSYGGQSFGGNFLNNPWCSKYLQELIRVIGSDTWEGLKGKYVRIKSKEGLIIAIGNFMTDDWFNPKDFIEDFVRNEKMKGVECSQQ